ncbi:MAG: hypothetical protein K6L76_09475 [Agarilytica sp.]
MQTNNAPALKEHQIYAEKVFSQGEFDVFAKVSGDNNPIHVDPEFSAGTRFGRTVSHGMLLYTVMWGQIQKHFPDSVQKKQKLKFPSPTYADDVMEIDLNVRPSNTTNIYSVEGVMRRKKDGETTCEFQAEFEYLGGLPC